MKSMEQTVKAINNRVDRIVEFQLELEKLMIVDDNFSEMYFEQEAIKSELISLLTYIEEI